MKVQPDRSTLLVVDDTPENIAVLREALSSEYRVKIALNGERALAIVAASPPPDLVLLDIMMPGMDGIEVLERIRATRPAVELPVIMVTARDESTDIVDALDRGANDYVTKPVDISVAVARIRTHLALKEATRALEQALEIEKDLLERTLAGSVKVMSDTLSLLAPDAYADASRVRGWIRTLTEQMGLREWWELNIAAMLAPLGKIGIQRDILAKARANRHLTNQEQELISHAPDLGRKLIANIPRLEGVAEIVYFAEKGFDGSSYPASDVAGEGLPLGSRILKILFDLASTTEGPFPGDKDFARLEARREHYDPALLDRVVSHLKEKADAPGKELIWQDVPVNGLRSGDVLGTDISLTNGHVFLVTGTCLSETHVDHLHRLVKVFQHGQHRFLEPISVVRERSD